MQKLQLDVLLRLDFTEAEKAAILGVLDKFGTANRQIAYIRNAVADDGWTGLHADEALMLAGLLLPWYEFISTRIAAHPGMFAPLDA